MPGPPAQPPRTLRVAVASLTPTGSSVGAALKHLGFNPYDLSVAFSGNRSRTDPPMWAAFLLGRGRLDLLKLRENDALCGLPAVGNVERLLEELPKYTKVVLLVETNKQKWADEFSKHVPHLMDTSEKLGKRSNLARSWAQMFAGMFPNAAATEKPTLTGAAIAGNANNGTGAKPLRDPIAILEDFEDEVKRRVPPHRLLVYHQGDGWEPLIHFLELSAPVPTDPFPDVDHGGEWYLRVRRKLEGGHRLAVVTYAGAAAVCVMVVGYWVSTLRAASAVNSEGAMARVRRLTGVQLRQRVFPVLEHLGPEAEKAGRDMERAFGLEDRTGAVADPASVTLPSER